MEVPLRPGHLLQRASCPDCDEEFDLETRKPFRSVGGCGHSICGVCVGDLTVKRPCSFCAGENPGTYNAEWEWRVHEEMIELLPEYKRLTTAYAESHEQLLRNVQTRDNRKDKLTRLHGARYVSTWHYSAPERRPECVVDWADRPCQLLELRQAMVNLRFDSTAVYDVNEETEGEANYLSHLIGRIVDGQRREEADNPYDASRSLLIRKFELVVNYDPDRDVNLWFHNTLVQMRMDESVVRRRKIEIYPDQSRGMKIEFESVQARNEFRDNFREAMSQLHPRTHSELYPDILDI